MPFAAVQVIVFNQYSQKSRSFGRYLQQFNAHLHHAWTQGRTELAEDGDVRRIVPIGDRHAPAQRHALRCIERIPAAIDIGFEPGMQIYRLQPMQIAHYHARWNAQAAAQGDAEMGEIAADAFAPLIDFNGRHVIVLEDGIGVQRAMDPVADAGDLIVA